MYSRLTTKAMHKSNTQHECPIFHIMSKSNFAHPVIEKAEEWHAKLREKKAHQKKKKEEEKSRVFNPA